MLKHSQVELRDKTINRHRPGKSSHFEIVIERDFTCLQKTYRSNTIYAILATLGGFFGLFSRLVGYIMSYFNGFNLEGSMIKRLYSVHAKDYKPE
jgi:hypothetical protein